MGILGLNSRLGISCVNYPLSYSHFTKRRRRPSVCCSPLLKCECVHNFRICVQVMENPLLPCNHSAFCEIFLLSISAFVPFFRNLRGHSISLLLLRPQFKRRCHRQNKINFKFCPTSQLLAESYKASSLAEALLNYLSLSGSCSLLDLLSRLSSNNEHSPLKNWRV